MLYAISYMLYPTCYMLLCYTISSVGSSISGGGRKGVVVVVVAVQITTQGVPLSMAEMLYNPIINKLHTYIHR
jgi:hypothetical protein